MTCGKLDVTAAAKERPQWGYGLGRGVACDGTKAGEVDVGQLNRVSVKGVEGQSARPSAVLLVANGGVTRSVLLG